MPPLTPTQTQKVKEQTTTMLINLLSNADQATKTSFTKDLRKRYSLNDIITMHGNLLINNK